MKKVFIASIIILSLVIIFIQYNIFRVSRNKLESTLGQVKSAQINASDVKSSDLSTPPEIINNKLQPNIFANSYVLIDVNSFYTLTEKNSHSPVPIASTTKILTAIVVLENYNLSDIVTISQNAAGQIGDDVALATNEKIIVENLLYILLIKSGNDSAMALAEFYKDGGKDGFMKKVSQKADYLGMKDTKLLDPAGLDDNAKSTAYDLAIAASYAMRNKKFAELVNTTDKIVTSTDGKFQHELKTSNRLINPSEQQLYLSFANGIKTGYTPDAGHCLVSSAIKDGHQLIGVILHTNENTITASAKESKKLLEWGFDNFRWK